MKILLCHNHYQQAGGEDQGGQDETRLWQSRGRDVIQYTRHNDEIKTMSRSKVARQTLWNNDSFNEIRRLLQRQRPDVVHCTNTFPLISPAVYHAVRVEHCAVVQALHNYRILCPGGLLLRDGRGCEECVGQRFAWKAIKHRCYRGSLAGSAVVAAMSATHRAMQTWQQAVDVYYALTEFSRRKFIQGGLPAERLLVKPNFVERDPLPGEEADNCAVFVGRLSEEKGIECLLDSWRHVRDSLALKIIGDGPFAPIVARAASEFPAIQWLGRKSNEEVLDQIGRARFLVLPSTCYENFPKTIVEAFAKRVPVIASRHGAMADIVSHEQTGLLFEPGNAEQLAIHIDRLAADAPLREALAAAARKEYEAKYTADANYDCLMNIYDHARRFAAARHASPASQPILEPSL